METASIDIRLRPIRFGFVVKPDDKANLRTIFEINTCLWGGRYNPVIPYLTRVPSWWERQGIRFDNARQIVNGYLDFFEPDFLVEAQRGLASTLGYESTRIIQLSDILRQRGDRDHRGIGLDVMDLYRRLYREEFQFVRRHPHRVVNVIARRTFETFAACVFGAFPCQVGLSYFREAFDTAFDPEILSLSAASFEALYRSSDSDTFASSALAMGSAKIDVNYRDRSDPTLFILDASQAKDLIDFWNYRVMYADVLAIPVQWLGEMSGFCREVIERSFRPLEGNPNGVMRHATTMFSRSIADDDINALYSTHLQTEIAGANVVQNWYPPIWRPAPDFVSHAAMPTLSAAQNTVQTPIDDESYIRFDGLDPQFAERFGGNHRWANVVRIKDWSSKQRIATVFPTNARLNATALRQVGADHLLSTTEGLVTFSSFKGHPHTWQLTDGATAICRWLDSNAVNATISQAGRPTQQIIQTLEGFRGVGAIAHSDVIGLLDQMSKRPITRSAHRHEFQNRLNTAVGRDIWRNDTFRTLVDRKAVELGYELKCPKCGSWSWHGLAQLGPEITCELCLRPFSFPMVDPSNSDHARWAYRVIGPFALPNYAGGAYAAALAIRFFGSVVSSISGPDLTWAGGHDLTFEDGRKAEADFILWYQRKKLLGTDQPTEVVFGEAKSFGRDAFQDIDIERMRMLVRRFPGSLCVFATLKEAGDLTLEETSRIRRFAEWGREYDLDRRQTRAPVLLLTGTELFASHSLDHAWSEKGGRHAELIKPAYVSTERLLTIADFTQQLYLGMPPYHIWLGEQRRPRVGRGKPKLKNA